MEFRGERHFDTGGGVPEFRNKSVTKDGASSYRVVDEFATGQIHSGTNYTFCQLDPDHVELRMTTGKNDQASPLRVTRASEAISPRRGRRAAHRRDFPSRPRRRH